MKNILTLILLGFVFIGCTTKVETDLQPYVTLHQNEMQDTKINFLGIEDQRSTKIAATILDDGKIKEEYPLNTDVKTWYTQAFTRELDNAKMIHDANKSDIDVKINIKNISAEYLKYSLDKKNMKAKIQIELVITKGKTINRSNIEIKQSIFKPMILDAEGFESIINESMRSSVSKTIEILIKKLKAE